MARFRRRRPFRRFRRRRGFRGLGSIISTRRISGLGRVGSPGSFLGTVVPPAVGGGTAALVAIGIRQFAKPAQSRTQAALYKYAPWLGMAAGAVAALGLYMMGGTSASLSGFVAAGAAGGALLLNDAVRAARPGEDALAMAGGGGGTTAGLRAIVPEYERAGMGAIVMEPQASRGYGAGALGSYGEVVNLGNINPASFGTPGFQI